MYFDDYMELFHENEINNAEYYTSIELQGEERINEKRIKSKEMK